MWFQLDFGLFCCICRRYFFALISGKNTDETQSSHSGKIPKKQLRDYNKDKNVSNKICDLQNFKIFFIFIETFLYLATEHYTLFGYQNFQAYPRGHEECWKICSPTVLPINASSHSFCLIVYKCNTIKLFKEAKRAFTFSENNNC